MELETNKQKDVGFNLDFIGDIFKKAHENTLQREKEKGKPIEQIENYLNTRIKNDPILVKQILRIYLSAYTNNPINLALLAPSSDGKTYATVQVSSIFPDKDIISVGRLSPTALIHQHGVLVNEDGESIEEKLEALDPNDEDYKTKKTELFKNVKNLVDLKNKILIFLDNPNTQTYEMLKPIMSHDKKEIIYKTTKGDGSLNVKETIIRNWPVFIFCSAKNEAKNEVWKEIETRVFVASPNSDIKKYQKANRLTAQKLSFPSYASEIYDNSEDEKFAKFYIRKLKEKILAYCSNDENPIFNPFGELISEIFPSNQGVSMRHFNRFMSFCNIETLINYRENMKLAFKTYEGKMKYSIITSLNDIDNAVKILGKISTVPPEQIKFYNKVFKPAIKEILNGEDTGLTSKQLAKKYSQVFKKPTTPKKVLENYLEHLVEHGIIEERQDPDDKRKNLYTSVGSFLIRVLR